jgi:hypothetical protein
LKSLRVGCFQSFQALVSDCCLVALSFEVSHLLTEMNLAFTRVCTPILKENCTWTEDFDINSNVETSPTRPNDCQHRSTTESYENPNLDNHLHGNRESFIMKRAKAELKEDSETALSLGIISQEPDSMLGRTISQISFEGVADFTKVFKEDKENDECVISAMESIPISYVERDTGIELVKPYESEEMPSAQIGPAEIGSASYKPYESQDVPTDCEYFTALEAFNFQ